MSTYYISPGAASGGDGSIDRPFNSWSIGGLRPGNTYLQRAGTTYQGVINVDQPGSAFAPIQIGTYGSGAAPVINGTVSFSGTSYVRFSGFTITNPNGSGVLVQNGSHHVEISNNVVTGAQLGIWIGGAGTDNSVHDNTVVNSRGIGIAVDRTSGTPGHETLIARNWISDSGGAGIQLDGNYAKITDNHVNASGQREFVVSGIHVYTSNSSTGRGNYNTITGNVVTYTHDDRLYDGSGILLDQWTHDNVVDRNFTLGNDGAGIALYDSYSNIVSNNVSGSNAVDSGRTHTQKAELSLNQSLGLTRNNSITGNVFLGTNPTGFAAFVDTQAASAMNSFSGNVIEHLASQSIYQVASVRGSSVNAWNQILSGSDRFSGVPITRPAAGTSYDYIFAPNTTIALDGRTVTLTGWTAAGGLFGV